MIGSKIPWEDKYHKSFFLPELDNLEVGTHILVSSNDIEWYQCPILTHNVYVEWILENISKTIPIDISMKLGVI